MSSPHPDPLHFVTWLAPTIPLALYRRIGEAVGLAIGRSVRISARYDCSGPTPGSDDPFGTGEADIGFVCAPSFLAMQADPAPTVELLGAAPVFDDPRNGARPVYFCDIAVREDDPATHLDDLRGRTFGYNDRVSLSGWWGLVDRLRRVGTDPDRFFGRVVQTGSHPSSLRALLAGDIDVISLDSTVFALAHLGEPHSLTRRVRVVESVGPWPIQPTVARADLDPALVEAVRDVLLGLGPWSDMALRGFAVQTRADLVAPSASPSQAVSPATDGRVW